MAQETNPHILLRL